MPPTPVGLVRADQSCFLNSALQLLASAVPDLSTVPVPSPHGRLTGVIIDEGSAAVLLRKMLKEWSGNPEMDSGSDPNHWHQLAQIPMKAMKAWIAWDKCISNFGKCFMSYRLWQTAEGKARSLPVTRNSGGRKQANLLKFKKKHKIRWAPSVWKRFEAAHRNWLPCVQALMECKDDTTFQWRKRVQSVWR